MGGSDVRSTGKLLGILKKWKRSYGTVLFSTSSSLRLWVDPFCPLEIHSLRDPLC